MTVINYGPRSAGAILRASPLAGLQKETFVVGQMTPTTANFPAAGTVDKGAGKPIIATRAFDAATEEFMQFVWDPPTNWDGYTVQFKAIWNHAAAATDYGVVWRLKGLFLDATQDLDLPLLTAVAVTQTGGSTDNMYITDLSTPVDTFATAQPGVSGIVVFQISRFAGDAADTLAIDARLVAVEIYYSTISIGISV